MADDLVDRATSRDEASSWVLKLHDFLEQTGEDNGKFARRRASKGFPWDSQQALIHLPLERMTRQPLFDMLEGFTMDLSFGVSTDTTDIEWPIQNVSSLMKYGHAVAGTVAELCLDLVFWHHGLYLSDEEKEDLKRSGNAMGKALQIVNISRDIQVDAATNRVYVPLEWLQQEGLTPEDVIENPTAPAIGRLRSRLLDTAFALYNSASPAIDNLPVEARGPMRAAVESYMEIGRVLRDEGYRVQTGRATVSGWRRIRTVLKALYK